MKLSQALSLALAPAAVGFAAAIGVVVRLDPHWRGGPPAWADYACVALLAAACVLVTAVVALEAYCVARDAERARARREEYARRAAESLERISLNDSGVHARRPTVRALEQSA